MGSHSQGVHPIPVVNPQKPVWRNKKNNLLVENIKYTIY